MKTEMTSVIGNMNFVLKHYESFPKALFGQIPNKGLKRGSAFNYKEARTSGIVYRFSWIIDNRKTNKTSTVKSYTY